MRKLHNFMADATNSSRYQVSAECINCRKPHFLQTDLKRVMLIRMSEIKRCTYITTTDFSRPHCKQNDRIITCRIATEATVKTIIQMTLTYEKYISTAQVKTCRNIHISTERRFIISRPLQLLL